MGEGATFVPRSGRPLPSEHDVAGGRRAENPSGKLAEPQSRRVTVETMGPEPTTAGLQTRGAHHLTCTQTTPEHWSLVP